MIINAGTTINAGITINGYDTSMSPTWNIEIRSWDPIGETFGNVITTVNEGDWIYFNIQWQNMGGLDPTTIGNLYLDGTNITQLDLSGGIPLGIGPENGFPLPLGSFVDQGGPNYIGTEIGAPIQISADNLTEGTETLHIRMSSNDIIIADASVDILDTSTGPTATIVTSGLLLNFDAATYSGTGDWIDSHAGVHAVPQNGPVWSSSNGGTFVLTAASLQYFAVPWTTFHPTYTVDVWFNYTGDPGGTALVSDEGDTYINFCIAAVSAGVNSAGVRTGWFHTNWEGQYPPARFPTDGTTWGNMIMAVGPTEYNVYSDGALNLGPLTFDTSGAPDGGAANGRFFIGRRWDGDITVDAKIAVVNIYNRALTAEEQLQNYNYYKTRFGLS